MKLCTKIRATSRQLDGAVPLGSEDIIDVSIVPDDHQFGVDSYGFLHIEGKVVSVTP